MSGVDSTECLEFCSDPVMNGTILNMHRMARVEGRIVQPFIDTYLAAVGYLEENPNEVLFSRLLVMSPTDSPQEGSLPDLGSLLRVVMLQAVEVVKRSGKSTGKSTGTSTKTSTETSTDTSE